MPGNEQQKCYVAQKVGEPMKIKDYLWQLWIWYWTFAPLESDNGLESFIHAAISAFLALLVILFLLAAVPWLSEL
jgi:hypothetical protein